MARMGWQERLCTGYFGILAEALASGLLVLSPPWVGYLAGLGNLTRYRGKAPLRSQPPSCSRPQTPTRPIGHPEVAKPSE